MYAASRLSARVALEARSLLWAAGLSRFGLKGFGASGLWGFGPNHDNIYHMLKVLFVFFLIF